jgi:hypothetical protein
MAVSYYQDRPALFEKLRFAKRQQWYVAASTVGLDVAVLAGSRGLELNGTEIVLASAFVFVVGFFSIRLPWELQGHIRNVQSSKDKSRITCSSAPMAE